MQRSCDSDNIAASAALQNNIQDIKQDIKNHKLYAVTTPVDLINNGLNTSTMFEILTWKKNIYLQFEEKFGKTIILLGKWTQLSNYHIPRNLVPKPQCLWHGLDSKTSNITFVSARRDYPLALEPGKELRARKWGKNSIQKNWWRYTRLPQC